MRMWFTIAQVRARGVTAAAAATLQYKGVLLLSRSGISPMAGRMSKAVMNPPLAVTLAVWLL
jgi:hypothetical protein